MEPKKIWKTALYFSAAAVGGWLFLRFLGPVLLPFGLGLLVARAADPAIRWLQRQTGVPRWLAAGICVLAVYLLVGLGLWLLCRILCREAAGFLRSMPVLAQSLAAPFARLQTWLLNLAERFPDGIGAAVFLSVPAGREPCGPARQADGAGARRGDGGIPAERGADAAAGHEHGRAEKAERILIEEVWRRCVKN